MNKDIEKAAAWVESQIADMKFGEASVRVVVHAGKVRIERCVIHRGEMKDRESHGAAAQGVK